MTLAGKWCPCLGIDEIRESPNFVSLPMLKRPGNPGEPPSQPGRFMRGDRPHLD